MTRSFPALGFDPTPGEADAVKTLMLQLATAAETISTTLPRLEEATKITDDAEWGGSAAEEFSDHGDDLPQGLGKGGEAINAVTTALSDWFGKLTTNQARADVLEAAAKKLKARLATFDSCTPEFTALGTQLARIVDDAKRLAAKHLREANATADAIRAGKDGDPFKPENDSWYVQGLDGLAVAADGVSLATATAAAGLAATGVGLPAAAVLEARQQQAYADLVDKGAAIAEKAGVELTPRQKAELKLLQQGINPTPAQLEKAIEDLGTEALK